MDDLLNDKRFTHVARDPKFKRIPKAERMVKIDKRFQSMFKNKHFTVQYTIDKRGRPVHQTTSENLRKYYELSTSEEEDDDDDNDDDEEKLKQEKRKKSKKQKKKKSKKNVIVESKENDAEHDTSKDEENDSDNGLSSNGELLRIKPTEETDKNSTEQSKSESESESDVNDEKTAENLKIDLKESKKQLAISRKKESNKLPNKIKEKLRDLTVNYARGEGILMSDSSSEEESSEASDEEEIEHDWGELDKDAGTTDEITHRLAICNMDWDRIRAVDLMVLFNSFLPSGGFIHSVTIYPSEFGLKRMKEEEINGPKELIEMSKEKDTQNDSDAEEGAAYHVEKLRQYQLNRLKYYYAVIVFDSAKTANKIYTECDGTEYESTAAKLDLRFIPDDMEFDQTPKEVCNELPELHKYEPRLFTNTALQQVKVDLTWDETNPERMEIAQKLNSGKLDEINKNDLQNYLATDSSADEAEEKEKQKESEEDKSDSEEEKNADPIKKYKALLKEIEEKEETNRKKDVELEFTWGLGTKEKAEKLVQERLKKDEDLTPFEQYLEKRKAKKKAKQEERKKRKNKDTDALDSEGSEMLDSDDDNVEAKNNKSFHRKEAMTRSSASSDDENEERRKAELELLLMDESENGKQHFNMKKIEENATMTKSKQKRLSKKKNGQEEKVADNFEVNVEDSRFNALFTSHHFNIDPADPHYRKTKGTEALIKEKLKRRAEDEPNMERPAKESKTRANTDLQALVKAVKINTKNMLKPIK